MHANITERRIRWTKCGSNGTDGEYMAFNSCEGRTVVFDTFASSKGVTRFQAFDKDVFEKFGNGPYISASHNEKTGTVTVSHPGENNPLTKMDGVNASLEQFIVMLINEGFKVVKTNSGMTHYQAVMVGMAL